MRLHIKHCLVLYLLESICHSGVDSACHLTPQINFPTGKQENSRMEGFVMNKTSGTALECFGKCIQNCQCKSLNICGKTCELNSGNQGDKMPSNILGCTYYELSFDTQILVSKSKKCERFRKTISWVATSFLGEFINYTGCI